MTERYALRRLRCDDEADVLAAFRSAGDMSRQGDVSDELGARRYVARRCADARVHSFAITDRDRLVGLIGVDVDAANKVGWFWYWMNASHRGRGLAARAAATVANWALGEGGLARLELGHRANNPASGAVARAAGFVQ